MAYFICRGGFKTRPYKQNPLKGLLFAMNMSKIKKGYSLKLISLLVAAIFLFSNIVYGIELSQKSHLRVPINQKNTFTRISLIMDSEKIFKEASAEIKTVATRLDIVKGRLFEISMNPNEQSDNGSAGDHVSVIINLGNTLKSKNSLSFTIAHELAHLLLLQKSFPTDVYQTYVSSLSSFETYSRECESAADTLAIMMLMSLPGYNIEDIVKSLEEQLQEHPQLYDDGFMHPSHPKRITAIEALAAQLEGLSREAILKKADEFINNNAFINTKIALLALKNRPEFMSRSQVISILVKQKLKNITKKFINLSQPKTQLFSSIRWFVHILSSI
jgi:hypothetical protein